MKKLLIALLCGLCITASVCFAGCAEGEAALIYTLSDDGTHYALTDVENKNFLRSVEVSATYEGLPVTEIGEGAFYGCYNLGEVTLPEGIEKIGNYAFAMCPFNSFTIPESVKEIGYSAFNMCQSLAEITVPAGVEKLGDRAFYQCKNLVSAKVKANITCLEAYTFANSVASEAGNVYLSSNIKSIYLPATLEKISIYALYGDFTLTDIYFEGGDEQWRDMYFYKTKKDSKGEVQEIKVDVADVLTWSYTVHFNQQF